MEPAPPSRTEHRCEKCGAFEARELGDHWLCDSCYTGCGSCCPEFGADDLWTDQEDAPPPPPPAGG